MDFNTAMANASNPSDFELQMKTLRRRSRTVKAPAAAAEPAAAPKPPDDKPLGFTDDISSMLQP